MCRPVFASGVCGGSMASAGSRLSTGSPLPPALDFLILFIVGPERGFAERLLQPFRKRPRGMMAARPQQLISRSDFDQNRHAAARGHRHSNQRHLEAEDLVELVV